MATRGSYGPRMDKHWSAHGGISFSATANGLAVGSPLNFDESWTVLRMIGSWIAGPDAAPTAQDQCTVTIGIGVFSMDAITLGITALPEPLQEPEFPWLYWESHRLFMAGTDVEGRTMSSVRRTFDIRSMRKIKPREGLVTIAQYEDGVGTPPVQINTSSVRTLVAR